MQLKKLLIIISLFLASCSQLEKAEDLINGLSEKEQYQKDRNISDQLFTLWKSRVQTALNDSLEVELPYAESGQLKPRSFAIYSYETYLIPGEVIEFEMQTDSTSTLIFSELYKKNKESGTFEKVKEGLPKEKNLSFEISEKGLYKIVLQPEIEAHTGFRINIQKSPTYLFPVANGRNADIGSYWGDIRDGGKRDHEGIDIFADRGTPVIAPTDGNIGYSGEKGLGGKQVWLRDPKRKQSLYYAHLDSIIPGLSRVKTGDTLGFVGNTGNARTTPPHLHFGIYRRNTGAIDPIGFVYQTESVENIENGKTELASRLQIQANRAKLRNKPASNNSEVLKTGKSGEILYVQGKTADWYHVRDSLDRSMYVHESMVNSAY